MNRKKIELQEKLIERLQSENKSKDTEIGILKGQVSSLRVIVEKAREYEKTHIECIKALHDAKEKYEHAIQDLMFEKMRYKAQIERLVGKFGEEK